MKKQAILILSFLVLLTGCSNQTGSLPDIPLKDAYSDCFQIGAAISPFNFSDRDPETRSLILKHFNAISPDNDLKPESLHPSPDVWNFQRADDYCLFGKENGMWILGHTLCWHNQTPSFFWTKPNGQTMSKDEIFESIRSYILKIPNLCT